MKAPLRQHVHCSLITPLTLSPLQRLGALKLLSARCLSVSAVREEEAVKRRPVSLPSRRHVRTRPLASVLTQWEALKRHCLITKVGVVFEDQKDECERRWSRWTGQKLDQFCFLT